MWPEIGVLDIGCHFPLGTSGNFGIPSCPADLNSDGIVDGQDLALMNACMGATDDPNLVQMDFNYDSWINMPDYGVLSWDFGYTADPNLPGRHDPNSARSDFNGDGQVDLGDMEVLAELWLTPVFDEYRFCSLCNLHIGIDPNDPNAPDGSHVIDQRDIDVFMEDWGKVYAPDPNIVIEQSASMLSIGIENPDPAWGISVFLDEELIGAWEAGTLGSTVFDADLTRYGPGSHRVKVVRNIGYGLEITEQVLTDPNSVGLYYADIPDVFDPNEPYQMRGFNLNDVDLNFRIRNILDETVYDVNVPTGVMNLSIPASAFEQSMMATFSATKTPITPINNERYEKILGQKFDRERYRNKGVRFLVLLPDRKTTKTFKEAIFTALSAIEKRTPNNPPIVLTGTDVNFENLNFSLYYTFGAKIFVYFGHANSHVGRVISERTQELIKPGVQRTQFQCYKKREGYFWDSYDDVGVVSYTRNTVYNAELLPDSLDNVVIDFKCLLQGSSSVNFVPIDQMYVFGCLSATFPDMANEQGCFGDHDNAYNDMIYCGYTRKITQNNANWLFFPDLKNLLTYINQGLVIFFNELGDGKTIPQAVSVLQQQDTGIRQALFGADGVFNNTQGFLDRSSEDDDTLTIYGLGYVGGVRFGYWGAQH